ncbi:MAG: prepilin-type N-terminal cleavage/methylation domain-containing protein [Planctomycetes bacterium]|nr:prepilin-type N-terminal cleavage/methylation domain-containing protein [Planctomycetota bacterium]
MNPQIARPSNRCCRGYTLLELMISLALLGGLMAVCWSLLDSVHQAERRAEGLARRVRELQLLQEQLQDDLQHLSGSPADGVLLFSSTAAAGESLAGFGVQPLSTLQGDENGFRIEFVNSSDPLEFISRTVAASDERSKPMLPFPRRTRAEYRLRSNEPSPGMESTLPPTHGELWRTVQELDLPSVGEQENRTVEERTLSSADLYRARDESSVPKGLAPARDSRVLSKLSRLRFRYSDGRSWYANWDSGQRQALPLAVAIDWNSASRTIAPGGEGTNGQRSSREPALEPQADLRRSSSAIGDDPSRLAFPGAEESFQRSLVVRLDQATTIGGRSSHPITSGSRSSAGSDAADRTSRLSRPTSSAALRRKRGAL